MKQVAQYLISKDNAKLQIPYSDYVVLMEKMEEAKRIRRVRKEVLSDLEQFMTGKFNAGNKDAVSVPPPPLVEPSPPTVQASSDEAKKAAPHHKTPASKAPAMSVEEKSTPAVAQNRPAPENVEIPPIKKEITELFNSLDGSGRLSNVFKQYYTCLNDACGGTVRVTMKDGFCSLWNYDAWEEFAFVDIFEGNLRFAVDPRYTDDLSSLNFCEVPRLLSIRRNLVCVQLGDLNKTMLGVLAKAFDQVGLAAG